MGLDATSLQPGSHVDVTGEGEDSPSYRGQIVATVQSNIGPLVILNDEGTISFAPESDLSTVLANQPSPAEQAELSEVT